MTKAEFAALSRPLDGAVAPTIRAESTIQEIQVAGTYAFMWARLEVTATPRGASQPIKRAGHTLSVLRKDGGLWRIARDANFLTVVSAGAA
jgi:ketosteroid isomerase-like protein